MTKQVTIKEVTYSCEHPYEVYDCFVCLQAHIHTLEEALKHVFQEGHEISTDCEGCCSAFALQLAALAPPAPATREMEP